ncbi:sentrin-specific protease 7-like [Acyrthosiphon pisum]|uniref:Ubiquitin-like protease family profile domain-containing protein n=1 Tax=Acyrthosiphon pisum TaxID=7029 RepID=A0A8R2NJP5_ACYPI|nr:sentrin-specific protease 7-like [Acyrthosiphon pisum]|eukprot:XP_016664087.1 PREDICTED: sentrin-specific protease 7-like [Acyrthosiphon pisum]
MDLPLRYISTDTMIMPLSGKRRRIDGEWLIKKPNKGQDDKVILQDTIDQTTFDIKICDYRLLEKGLMMSDALIDFYLAYMHSKLSDKDKEKAYVFSTHFYSCLTKQINQSTYDPSLSCSKNRHNKVEKWTKKVNIFKKDFIFIPINKYQHWCLAVICFPYLSGKVYIKQETHCDEPDDNTGRYEVSQCIRIPKRFDEADPNVEDLWLFDLCLPKNYQDRYSNYYDDVEVLKTQKKNKLIKRPCILIFDSYSRGILNAMITATLREWLQHEYCKKYNGEQKDFQFMKACSVKVPQQPNKTDCGLFVMHYFEMWVIQQLILNCGLIVSLMLGHPSKPVTVKIDRLQRTLVITYITSYN